MDKPNSHHIEEFEEELKDTFDYNKLKGQSPWDLQKTETDLEILVREFKNGFPGDESVVTGDLRKFANDDELDDKVPLNPREKRSISLLKQDIQNDIRRAKFYWYRGIVQAVFAGITVVLVLWGAFKYFS